MLLALKISPLDVLHLLEIIETNPNDRKTVERLTLEYYKQNSKSTSSPHLHPFRTRVGHSLKKLRLTQGENQNITLTPEGKHLRSISSDIEKYKSALARMILRLDDEKCHVVPILQKFKKPFKYDDIVEELKKKGMDIKPSDDKLRRWLQFLTYCEILHYDPPKYTFDSNMVEALEMKPQPISLQEFKKSLYAEYARIKNNRGTYVPIPLLKDAVSTKLKAKGFVPLDFKEYLLRAIHEKPDRNIVLFETGVRQAGGILHNKTYYHFLTILEK